MILIIKYIQEIFLIHCPTGQYSPAKVHRLLKVNRKPGVDNPMSFEDYDIQVDELPGLACEVLDGE